MAKQIKFTDGSVFIGYDFEYVESSGGYSGLFPNAAIIVRAGEYTTPNFTKTDLDGHVWTWNGTKLSISGTSISISVPDYGAVFMNPIGDDNSQRGINAFSGFNNYYTSTHEWMGTQGVANGMTIGSFISQYQYYACYDVFINETVQIELKSDDKHSGPRYSSVWGSFGGSSQNLETIFPNSYQDYVAPPEDTDPYNPGGSSGTGGGTGNFSGTGDNIDIPSLPTLSATNTGFITLFNPSAEELRNLADYMWSNPLFDVAAWKKIFADPMDAILGLSIVPVAVPNGGQLEVTVGNISTGVSMNKAGAQYVSVDCGTLNVEEYWGAYLDYDPYTKAEIYLPYIGIHPLSVDDIMGKAVHVVYHVDILSGACCAYVKCGGSVLYSFVGQCSCSIPITGNDWTNVINGTLTIAASIGTMVATGGASAPLAAGAIASTAVNSMKPNVEKSGSMGGMGGMLGVQTPYLILTRPRQATPKYQNKFSGYPSFITMSLGECSGYTEVDTVHLENIAATEQELSEIERLLKGGVIL